MPFEKRNQGFFPRRLAIGILVFVIVSTLATCSEALAGFQQTQYALTREHRLKKSLIYEQEVESLLDCGHLCLAELYQGCKSINFEKEETKNMYARKKCQLNNETKMTKPERLIPDPAFNYYEVINMKESDQTCEAKGTFVANFTNLGASGRFGPTSLGLFYAGQDHENMVTVVNGTQYWTVPFTGTYQITAVGASGGYDKVGPAARGRGAYMKGDFDLNKGEVIKILVGQEGVEYPRFNSAGGGGGTFVVTSSNKTVIIAGGGGGIQKLVTRLSNCDASVGTSGKENQCVEQDCSSWSGGVNGSGALEADNGSSGGGGGGFYSNGRSSTLFGGKYGNGGEGGKSFLQGGAGGRAVTRVAVGGFGGGGGANGKAGGAGGSGGYSGGASGDNVDFSCGGGGGSYNSGRNQENSEGFQDKGHGYVEINRIFPDV